MSFTDSGRNPYEAPAAPLQDESRSPLRDWKRRRHLQRLCTVGGVLWLGFGLLWVGIALDDRGNWPFKMRVGHAVIGLVGSTVGVFLLEMARRSARFAELDRSRVE